MLGEENEEKAAANANEEEEEFRLQIKMRLLQFGPRENYISGPIPLLFIKLTLTSFSIK